MIVKKIQTKKCGALKSKALHVRDLCDYIAGPNAGDADEKVEHKGATNMLNVDHAGQVEEMADLAETARRSPQPVQHWIISWRQGEQPTAAQADAAVRMFLDEMGLGEHQCVYALHRNTDNFHLHLAVNRVHPDTERVVTVNGGFDIEVAHRAIARIERAQGWEREARGRYLALDDGELRRAPALEPERRQPTTRGRDLENQIGEKSAQRLAIERGAEALRRARHWQELHLLLADRDMRFERKGSGAVLWIGDVAVKASTAGRDCSLSALEKRLGEFVPDRDRTPVRQLAPEPVEPAAKGWKTYAHERQTHYAERTQQREQLREQNRNRWQEMLERHREERRDALARDWRGQGARLNGLRSKLAARQAQEKAQVRERQLLERERLREQFPRWPPFEEWLRKRGNRELADEWRFRDRTPASIVGDREDPARPRDIRAFTAEVRGWEVHYGRADEPRSGPSFVDRGREIMVHDLRRESVLAALQLSGQKWGTFQVFGSDQYKRLCVDLAIEQGFRITNPELQQTIADERAARRMAPSGRCVRRRHGGSQFVTSARPTVDISKTCARCPDIETPTPRASTPRSRCACGRRATTETPSSERFDTRPRRAGRKSFGPGPNTRSGRSIEPSACRDVGSSTHSLEPGIACSRSRVGRRRKSGPSSTGGGGPRWGGDTRRMRSTIQSPATLPMRYLPAEIEMTPIACSRLRRSSKAVLTSSVKRIVMKPAVSVPSSTEFSIKSTTLSRPR